MGQCVGPYINLVLIVEHVVLLVKRISGGAFRRSENEVTTAFTVLGVDSDGTISIGIYNAAGLEERLHVTRR